MIENVYTVSSAKMKLKASETTWWKILWKIMEMLGETVSPVAERKQYEPQFTVEFGTEVFSTWVLSIKGTRGGWGLEKELFGTGQVHKGVSHFQTGWFKSSVKTTTQTSEKATEWQFNNCEHYAPEGPFLF